MKRSFGSVSKALLMALAFLIAVTPVLSSMGGVSYAEEEKEYLFGSADICSTVDKEMLKDTFYYSDDWFSEDPEVRNDELALMSMQLVGSVMDDKENGSGAKLLKSLGFSDIGFFGFESEDPDDCAYIYGKKKVGGDTLIAVAIQSYALESTIKMKGWIQNFTVNGDDASGEHEGLSKAAESVLGKIAALSDGADGKVKYWITGHSRGGAITDLLSAKLPDALSARGKTADIYGYTFEAPAVVDADLVSDQSKYGYIHNYSCSDDIVTMVPPADWGMTLYGVRHELKTEETDAKLNEELEKLGSSAKLDEEDVLGDYTAEYIIGKLLSRIPERKDYTRQLTDTVTTSDGQSKTLEYTPQGTFVRLMEVLFGDDRISTEGIADRMEEAEPALDAYIRAYLTEKGKLEGDEGKANTYYYKAAEELCKFLKPEEGKLPFDEDELYAILKLAAPVLIDPDAAERDESYAVTDEQLTLSTAVIYLLPAMIIATNKEVLVFSHQFDTSYARLKLNAPAPDFDGVDLEIPEPEAGDAVSKMPRAVEKAVDELGYSWLDASAKWDMDDPLLKDNKVQYLNVKYYVKGHTVPDSASFMINGNIPVSTVKTSVRDGITTISCAYQYTFGTPATRKVNFSSDVTEDPEPVSLPVGTMLKYIEYPVPEDVEGYIFGGWYDPASGDWDDVVVKNEEIYLDARWVEQLDSVSMTFTVPSVGQKWAMPSVPKNAPYHLEKATVTDPLENEIETIKIKGQHMIEVTIVPNSDKFAFAENGEEEYNGTINVKGATIDYYYMGYEKTINLYCTFTPLDNKVTALQKGGDFKMADKVIRASKSNKSLKGSSKSPLRLRAGKKTKKTIKLTWKKAKGARSYVVYGALKGKKMTKITTLKKASFTVKKAGKKLAAGKKYKFIVVAVGSGSKVVSTSATVLAKTAK